MSEEARIRTIAAIMNMIRGWEQQRDIKQAVTGQGWCQPKRTKPFLTAQDIVFLREMRIKL